MQHRQGHDGLIRKRDRRLFGALQEIGDGIEIRPLRGADQGDGAMQFLCQGERIDGAAACREQVGHVEKDDGRQAEREDRRSQHQLALQVERIEHQQHRIRGWRAGHAAMQDVDCNASIFRRAIEAVNAGQIDQHQVFAADAGHAAEVLLHRDAGVVRDFLAKTSQTIE